MVFVVNSSKFLLPLSAKSRKRLKMKRKISMARKKAKVNVNIDCYSLIKRSVKSQGIFNFLVHEWQPCYYFYYYYHYYIMGDELFQ